MLRKLSIQNYAIIDKVEVSFDEGLNIITGETGAGKSIIMGALGLILGHRADGKYFFDETRKCIIEGTFNIVDYNLTSFFQELDIDYEDETIIRREVSTEGKSRAFVNDSPVTLQVLKQLSEQLIDIHSQHATLQINTEKFQLFVLDNIAQNLPLLNEYRHSLGEFRKATGRLNQLQDDIQKSQAELDYHQFVFNELEEADLDRDNVDELESEQQRLENAEAIKRALNLASFYLDGEDQNALSKLKDALDQIQSTARFFSDIEPLSQRLESCFIELKDIAGEIESQEQTVFVDDERLESVSSRLSQLFGLMQKYRISTLSDLKAFKVDIEEKIQIVSHQEDALSACNKDVERLENMTRDLAKKISEKRKLIVPEVEQEIKQVLAQLGMPYAQTTIKLSSSEGFGNFGMDDIQFLFTANKGQTLQEIQKVASGGELSRVMLAVKSLVARSSALPTIIFDEIDTGISGEVALQVGEVMEALSKNMQVITITHLPQIASKGDRHFRVKKDDMNDKTLTSLQQLDDRERIVEIATMLSGANPSEAAISNAKSLLGTR